MKEDIEIDTCKERSFLPETNLLTITNATKEPIDAYKDTNGIVEKVSTEGTNDLHRCKLSSCMANTGHDSSQVFPLRYKSCPVSLELKQLEQVEASF